jgi:hypothetical protein
LERELCDLQSRQGNLESQLGSNLSAPALTPGRSEDQLAQDEQSLRAKYDHARKYLGEELERVRLAVEEAKRDRWRALLPGAAVFPRLRRLGHCLFALAAGFLGAAVSLRMEASNIRTPHGNGQARERVAEEAP